MKGRVAQLLLFIALIMALSAPAEQGTIQADRLNLRGEPSIFAEVLGEYAAGTAVEILEGGDEWLKVRLPDGKEGYMSAQYVGTVATATIDNGGDYVNLRSGPSLEAAILGTYESGAQVQVYGRQEDWSYVGIDGKRGYIITFFLRGEGETERPAVIDAATPPPPQVDSANPYLLLMDEERSLIQQYGVSESLVSAQDGLNCTIYYPVSGIDIANETIRAWAQQVVDAAMGDAARAGLSPDTEITIQYDSYRIDNRYASVQETGWMVAAHLTRPQDIVYTMNIDLQQGALLTYRDIFTPAGLAGVLALLDESVSAIGGLEQAVQVEEGWLKYISLMPEGVAVLLPRGEFLPASLGTQRIVLSYDALEQRGLMAISIDPAGWAPPTPEPEPTPAIPDGQRYIDPSRPMVALTFDDGPSDVTLEILELLDQVGGRATFFMVGNRVGNYENIVRRVAQQGSEIGGHTFSHKSLPKLSKSDIRSQISRTNEAIEALTGIPVKLVRPPYGSYNGDVRAVARELDLLVLLWSVDTEDWRTRSSSKTYDAIMSEVRNGSIVLCHDLYESTGDAMKRVIPELAEMGYQLVTVSELLSFVDGGAQAGSVYSHLDVSHLQ